MAGGFDSFAKGFSDAFEAARNARLDRQNDRLTLELQREKLEFEQGIALRAQSLEEQKAQFENRAKDAQALQFWSKAMDPSFDPAMRKFMLREGAGRLGVETNTQHFKEFDKMLSGLRPETLQNTRRLLIEAHQSAPPGWLSSMSTSVANGEITLTDALEQAQQFAQQAGRQQVAPLGGGMVGGGLPSPQPQAGPTGPGMFDPTPIEQLQSPQPSAMPSQPAAQSVGQPPAFDQNDPAAWRREALRLSVAAQEAAARGDTDFATRLEQQRDFALETAEDIQTGTREQERLEFERGQDPAEQELKKELGKRTGELWSKHVETANQSAGLAQDFELLDQLIEVAPQGGLTGRLAEAFPQASDAGAAFTSIVNRLAPTLRVEGSGSTSDLEFDAMRSGFPRLRNRPEANRLISAAMKAKAEINIARGEVVTAFQNGQLTANEARKQLSELDRESIMTPELRRLLEAEGADQERGVSEMSDEELRAIVEGE
ncbi:hypothetical protein [Nitratireductor luteus]|uniref:hypothetical protein n=1 Tax=Nitratireductor luteus TaxID=2976980 RepID=UPI00223F3285|nr:hypothetical protein [Nitratireductor luteus]